MNLFWFLLKIEKGGPVEAEVVVRCKGAGSVWPLLDGILSTSPWSSEPIVEEIEAWIDR